MKDEKSSSIEDVIKNLDYQSSEPEVDRYYHEQVYAILKERHKKEIIKSALIKYYKAEEMKIYQAELIKMQAHLERTGKKMIILFDGRDASGKGGTIRRVTRYMNEKHYRVVALGKPNPVQRTELHMKRYIEQFPRAGEIVLLIGPGITGPWLSRLWLFVPVINIIDFLKKVTLYENNFILDAGQTVLLKLYFSVSKEEQANRFERRRNDPLRQWKLSEVDLQAQDLWDEFTQKKMVMLQKTHTKPCPWWIIKSDDKHQARLESMKLILRSVKYRGRRRSLDYEPDAEIVVPGNIELMRMKKQIKEYGKPLR